MDVARGFPELRHFLLRMIVPEEEGGRGMEVPELTSTTRRWKSPRVPGTSHPCVPSLLRTNIARGRGAARVHLRMASSPAAECYGEIRVSLRRRGLPTGETDVLIAAIAVASNSVLATRNGKHFRNIEQLTIED
jgi:hypothetical protein